MDRIALDGRKGDYYSNLMDRIIRIVHIGQKDTCLLISGFRVQFPGRSHHIPPKGGFFFVEGYIWGYLFQSDFSAGAIGLKFL